MPSPGCLRCGSQSCSCRLIYDTVTGFPTPGSTLAGAGTVSNPIRVRVPSCEDVQDCVGPMLGWTNGFVYNDTANRWDGTGTVGDVLTLQSGGNVAFAPVPGGTGPNWTGTGGNGITITPGGIAGHSPTIAVNIGGACNGLDFVGGALRFREHRSIVSSIVTATGNVPTPISDGTDITNQFPVSLVLNNPSTCRTLPAQMMEVHQWNSGANSPAGEGTISVGGTRTSGFGPIGSAVLSSHYKNTATSYRGAIFEGGVVGAGGSVTQTKGGAWMGGDGRNTTGLASLQVRTWIDALGSTNT